MKKPTKKVAAPAPAAAKPAAKAPVKTVVKSKAPAAKPAAPAKKTAVTAPAKSKSAAASESPATFITASIDIGFGNHLFVRGTGPGLSWDTGLAMECVGSGLWTVAIKNATKPVTFKVLVNDLSWSTGADFVAEAGQSVTIYPSF